MTIGIDIRVLGNPVKSGVEEYTENLLAHLLPLDKNIKFKLFFSSLKGDLPEYDWLSLENVELHKFRIPNKVLFASAGLLGKPKIDELLGGVDVFFSPHFFLAPLSGTCRRVTTFHDLSYVHFKEFFSLRKNIWHNIEMKPLWQSHFSDQIIAVSESTRNDLIKMYQIDPAKIEVIYSGVSSKMVRPPEDKINKFKMKNKLPGEFILFLGKLEPRKNVASIIKAFNIVKSEPDRKNLSLILVGSRGWLYDDIFREIEKSPYSRNIIIKNHISDNERNYFYSAARVFVYPSFFEGFGFPPLEAMACGTPVITSNNSSLPEVVGDAGLLADPANVNDLAGSISGILKDKALKSRLKDAGLIKAANFTWQKTAEKTLTCILNNADKT